MAAVWRQLSKDGEGWTTKPLTFQLRGCITGTDDEATVDTTIKAATPLTMTYAPTGQVLMRQNISVERVSDAAGGAYWTASVQYGIGVVPWSFSTTGQTTHVTQSLSTVASYGVAPPDFSGGIGYDKQSGQFQGVDITTPQFQWSETYTFSTTDAISIGTLPKLTWDYAMDLYALTGSVNTQTFRNCAAGEVKFEGATGGQQKNDNEADVTFSFTASPNATFTIPGITGTIAKKGWEYLWVLYSEDVDSASGSMIKKPIAAYVEQVYPNKDFSGLGI